MKIRMILYCVIAICLTLAPLSGAPVKRMDIFDNAGNSLLFVEFEYDNNGNNIARSVFMADSSSVLSLKELYLLMMEPGIVSGKIHSILMMTLLGILFFPLRTADHQ